MRTVLLDYRNKHAHQIRTVDIVYGVVFEVLCIGGLLKPFQTRLSTKRPPNISDRLVRVSVHFRSLI